MNKYVIVKLEETEYTKSYDDIKPDKYLRVFKLDGSPYPYKDWTRDEECAIWFSEEEDAKKLRDLLYVNSPYPLKIIKLIDD
jgi:hypothetical protein